MPHVASMYKGGDSFIDDMNVMQLYAKQSQISKLIQKEGVIPLNFKLRVTG